MRHVEASGAQRSIWTRGGLLCALGGILATVGFLLPWFSSRVIAMPGQTVEISTLSGLATTFPVALPIVLISIVVSVIGLLHLFARQIRPMVTLVALALAGTGLVILLIVTLALFQDQPMPGVLSQVEVGLPLTEKSSPQAAPSSAAAVRRASRPGLPAPFPGVPG